MMVSKIQLVAFIYSFTIVLVKKEKRKKKGLNLLISNLITNASHAILWLFKLAINSLIMIASV